MNTPQNTGWEIGHSHVPGGQFWIKRIRGWKCELHWNPGNNFVSWIINTLSPMRGTLPRTNMKSASVQFETTIIEDLISSGVLLDRTNPPW